MGKKEYLINGLKKFIKRLGKDFDIEQIILFGSRAGNEFNEHSDVDLIIVSEDFECMNFFERVKKMYNYWEIDLPVDFICYTSKEFNKLKKQVSIVSEALREGIKINT